MQMAHINRTCGECALRQNGICPIFNVGVEAAQGACLSFTRELTPCELCGNIIIGSDNKLIDITIPDERHIICRDCKKTFGHCASCKNRSDCDFETNPSDIPKLIQKELRQGNMIQIMTVKNPSRIEITCKKGCPCFLEEFGCLKENNTCGNYKIIYEGR